MIPVAVGARYPETGGDAADKLDPLPLTGLPITNFVYACGCFFGQGGWRGEVGCIARVWCTAMQDLHSTHTHTHTHTATLNSPPPLLSSFLSLAH